MADESSKMTFRLPSEAHQELKRWAIDRGETLEVLMGGIIRGALKAYKSAPAKTPTEPAGE